MSLRVDTSQLIAGSFIVGDPGLGVLAQSVPSSGDNGPGFAYEALSFPSDTGKEVRARILSWPLAGTLTAYEDTSFRFEGADGDYSFTYQLYLDGVASGGIRTVTLSIGSSQTGAHYLSVSNSTQAQTSPGIAIQQTSTSSPIGRPASDVSTGSWTASTGTTLAGVLDETTASDTDYITASGTSPCTLALNPVTTPAAGTTKTVKVRAWSPTSGSVAVELLQNTTVIASWTQALTTSATTYSFNLTSTQAGNITDYSALRVRLTAA